MAKKQTPEQVTQWLAEDWGRCFAGVMESMADVRPSTSCSGIAEPFQESDGAVYSEQEFNLGPGSTIRLSVPELVWREAGARVLRAAGIEDVGRDDALSTFHEILSQTFSGLAQAMSARLGREVTCTSPVNKDTLPGGAMGLALSVVMAGAETGDYPVFISPTAELTEQLRDTDAPPAASPAPPAIPEDALNSGPSSMSKTFDLLLGVHLPVSVSFGKTSLMVKEVLKLTTGSIVELNRAVTEPVDIIVNNCIIARGDVVVVAGNYGVRVREIVSKEQRYQTSIK
jgi:flagellar motor switch protein FliN/FliY